MDITCRFYGNGLTEECGTQSTKCALASFEYNTHTGLSEVGFVLCRGTFSQARGENDMSPGMTERPQLFANFYNECL